AVLQVNPREAGPVRLSHRPTMRPAARQGLSRDRGQSLCLLARGRTAAPSLKFRRALAHFPFRLGQNPFRNAGRTTPLPTRRGAGVVERDGLENRCTGNRTVGSNPTLSASTPGALN